LSAIVAPYYEVATTCPDHTSEKIKAKPASLFRAFHTAVLIPSGDRPDHGGTSSDRYNRVSAACRISANGHCAGCATMEITPKDQDVEVCDGRRRAH
jgi:hypothetical protein